MEASFLVRGFTHVRIDVYTGDGFHSPEFEAVVTSIHGRGRDSQVCHQVKDIEETVHELAPLVHVGCLNAVLKRIQEFIL